MFNCRYLHNATLWNIWLQASETWYPDIAVVLMISELFLAIFFHPLVVGTYAIQVRPQNIELNE